jgi:putative hemolysin
MVDLMTRVRHDYKFMVNRVLSRVKPFEGNFIAVTPVNRNTQRVTGASLQGVRETMRHLREGHPMGFFPAGAVSDFSLRDLSIEDRPWQPSILRLIHAARVPVLPVRFFDGNSPFFYLLGLISWRIRVLRMPSELFNKKKKDIRIGIGNPISVEEQERFDDPEALGAFLRKTIYDMPMPASFVSRSHFDTTKKPWQINSV